MDKHARSLLLAASLAGALPGCAAKPTVLARVPPRCAFSREGDRILCDGAPYAELLRRGCEATPQGRDRPPREGCRALGIRYSDGSAVTLFAARPDLEPWGEGDYSARTRSELFTGWAYDIEFDAATGRVTYRRPGTFGMKQWGYDVGTGRLVRLE